MGRRYDTISFLSDYGTVDEFVGLVKAVVRDIAPHASVIDLTHNVAPFDVRAGGLTLARCISYVPSGIVLAVVDPGVGTDRKAVAVEVADGEGIVIGPDNGLIAPAVAMAGGAGRTVLLTNVEYQLGAAGATFAGRDIFAPAAAHLCNGIDLYELGEPIEPDLLMPAVIPLSREEGGVMLCEVLWVDRFGNCQLNVSPDDVAHWGDRLRVSVGDRSAPTVRAASITSSFDAIGTGAVGLVIDSYGMLALALDRRSAAEELGVVAGDQVVLSPLADDDGAGGSVSTPVTMRSAR